MEKTYFKNNKGNKLCGIVSNPSRNKNKPIIILCHGFSTSKEAFTYMSLEKILNEKGISTFRFDFFGHGESEGKFENITISEAVDDVLNAIKFLKSLGYTKIGLFGSSFGGIANIMAASKSEDLFVLALKAPVSYLFDKELLKKDFCMNNPNKEIEEWKNKGYRYYEKSDGTKLRLNYEFIEDSKNNNGYKAAEKIKIHTIIVHGDADNTVPIEQSKKTASIIKNCKLEIIKGANHKFSNSEDFKRMLKLISEFIINTCE